MPVPYRCPKGGQHERVNQGNVVVCRKCGAVLVLLDHPTRAPLAPRRPSKP